MSSVLRRPEISVLVPAYNAERYLLGSLQSVLAQTFEDFELLVIDDGSTDRTADILSAVRDRRLRTIRNPRNLGIVGSLNRGLAEASGRYIARIDADDFCLPTRFARQHAFLEENPRTLVVGAAMAVLHHGRIGFGRQRADPDWPVLQWMLHVHNPVGHPSIMFRADAAKALGIYLREDYRYAEDFDFLHRIRRAGEISVLPEHLVIYRQHTTNATRVHRAEMIAATARVLRDAYCDLFGNDRGEEAMLVAAHLTALDPPPNSATLERLGGFLSQLVERFSDSHRLDVMQRHRVRLHAGHLWWRAIRAAVGAGRIATAARHHGSYRWSDQSRPRLFSFGRPLAVGLLRRGTPRPPENAGRKRVVAPGECDINGVRCEAVPVSPDDPPVLHIVVDTEAEFDWQKPFDRSLTSVKAMGEQIRAQAIFDGYGARPVYVMDYAVASQPEGFEPLRAIFDRKGCAIGAHLHPWINPPFEETISDHNSFAGNLPPDLEARKLRALVAMIQANFGVSPLFFKAGRYGVGRATIDTLARMGFAVDFSILPLADLRARGGADFRHVEARPYLVGASRILSLPMTRGQIGLLAPLPVGLHSALRSRIGTALHLPGILSRARIANTVTLTPEGVPAAEQIQLIRSMAARGCRTFTLHYHSPSLAKLTPYVTSERALAGFLRNLETVCRFFFDTLGGMPGNPADLLPPGLRDRTWPAHGAMRALPLGADA